MQGESIPFDLHASVECIVKMLAPRALSKGLAFETAMACDVPRMVKGDPVRIRQVLINLLVNAVKFTEKGSVRLEASLGGDPAGRLAVVFRIGDTGIGIDAKTVGRLFTPFTQADSATTRKYGGTGLGLAISRRLVSLMGGVIGVESEPGKGSTFWFWVPLGRVRAGSAGLQEPQPVAAPLPPGGPAQAPPDTRRILIVEDHPVNQIVALRAVRSWGYLADVVSSGEAALEAWGRDSFDLILMDCQMPEMDGYEAAAEIRRREDRTARVPIVAMTADTIAGDQEKCRASGMDDYLLKPVRFAVLARTLERWLPVSAPGPAGNS